MAVTPRSGASFTEVDKRALASVATQFFLNGAIFASFIPRLPEIRDRIDVSIGVLGGLLTVAGAIGLLGSLAVSKLIERFSTRRVLIGGAACAIATLPVVGFATAPIVFALALGALSALDVLVDVAMNLQGSWLSARRHAPVMNRLHGLWSLGTVVGGLASAQLTASGVSLQTHLVAVAAVLGCALVFVGRGLLVIDEVPSASHTDDLDSAPSVTTSVSAWLLILVGLGGAFAVTVETVSSDWAAFRLTDDFDASGAFGGLAFVAFTVGMTCGRLGGDAMLHRLGRDNLARFAVVVATLGLSVAALAPNRYAVLVGYAAAGIGMATFFPRLYDEAAQMPGKRGAGIAALTAGTRAAGLVVPVTVGALAATSLSVGSATGIVVIPCSIAYGVISLGKPATRG